VGTRTSAKRPRAAAAASVPLRKPARAEGCEMSHPGEVREGNAVGRMEELLESKLTLLQLWGLDNLLNL